MARIIAISGPDGTGKSTTINAISALLQERDGVAPRVTWRRSGFLVSRIFNACGRVSGCSYYEITPYGSMGYHNYQGSIGWLYIFLVWIDCVFYYGPIWVARDFFSKGSAEIIDRYYLDIVADVIVSTGKVRAAVYVFDRLLKAKLKGINYTVLTCDVNLVMDRRPDLAHDRDYSNKVRAYKLLRRFYKLPTIDTGVYTVGRSSREVLSR